MLRIFIFLILTVTLAAAQTKVATLSIRADTDNPILFSGTAHNALTNTTTEFDGYSYTKIQLMISCTRPGCGLSVKYNDLVVNEGIQARSSVASLMVAGSMFALIGLL